MVFRIEKSKDYTVMSNFHLKDKNLSLKAKGLLSLMLSLPEEWDYSIAGLTTLSKDGETAVRSAIKELEDNKYLKRSRVYENGKIVDWDYTVYENPQELVDEDLVVENQQVGFQRQLNTNKQSNVLSKDNTYTEKQYSEPEFEFGKPRTAKPNLYQSCSALIQEFSNVKSIQDLLFQYLNLCMEMKSIRGVNQWKGMLNTLNKVWEKSHPHTFEEIIQRSIEHGWKTFYEIKDTKTNYSVKQNVEMIQENDYDKYSHKKANREF